MIPLVGPASAHGGEDHGAPVAAPSAGPSVTASSSLIDVALRLDSDQPGAPTGATLLLADWATSAPVRGTASLSLGGPGPVALDFAPTANPGVLRATGTFPAPGTYAGALTATLDGGGQELLAVSGVQVGAPHDHPEEVAGTGAGWLLLGVAAVLVAGAVGYRLGRGAVATLAALLALAGAERARAHGGEDHGAPAPPPAPVGRALPLPLESQFLIGLRTVVAGSAPVREGVEAWGHLVARPGGAADLRAPVDGVVEAGPGGFPSPGDPVRPGDVLAVVREVQGSLDRAALAEQRAAAVTRLAEARKALALAERDAEQATGLGASLPERERLERTQAVEVAREAYRQADLEVATLASGATAAVRSPLEGRLGGLLARPGDQVQAGDPLFRVLDARSLWAEVLVPEAAAPGITAGAPATVWVPSAPERPLPAVVLDAGQEVDPTTGLLRVTLAVEGADPGLRPGMGVRAWIAQGEPRLALVVPDSAVVDAGGSTLAFVKTGPETFATREIALGARVPEGWEVRAGVAAGERVVTDGTYALKSIAGR